MLCPTQKEARAFLIAQQQKNPHIRTLILEKENLGTFCAYKKGVEIAHGDFVLLADIRQNFTPAFFDAFLKKITPQIFDKACDGIIFNQKSAQEFSNATAAIQLLFSHPASKRSLSFAIFKKSVVENALQYVGDFFISHSAQSLLLLLILNVGTHFKNAHFSLFENAKNTENLPQNAEDFQNFAKDAARSTKNIALILENMEALFEVSAVFLNAKNQIIEETITPIFQINLPNKNALWQKAWHKEWRGFENDPIFKNAVSILENKSLPIYKMRRGKNNAVAKIKNTWQNFYQKAVNP